MYISQPGYSFSRTWLKLGHMTLAPLLARAPGAQFNYFRVDTVRSGIHPYQYNSVHMTPWVVGHLGTAPGGTRAPPCGVSIVGVSLGVKVLHMTLHSICSHPCSHSIRLVTHNMYFSYIGITRVLYTTHSEHKGALSPLDYLAIKITCQLHTLV